MALVICLRADQAVDGLVGSGQPRLSWQVAGAADGWLQDAYQLRIERAGRRLEADRVDSPDQLFAPWPFEALKSRETVSVQARVWGPDGQSPWSQPLRLEAGLLERSDWSAELIQPPRLGDDLCAYLRREFALPWDPADPAAGGRARLYASAQGVYRLVLNGQPVGPERLAPGWTSYRHRLRYQVYDVAGLLRPGPNVLAALLADGWFAGRLGWWRGGLRHNYGEKTGLIAQLELTAPDGGEHLIVSDRRWRAGQGGIVATSYYDGETFDQSKEPAGWDRPGFDDSAWSPVQAGPLPPARLVAPAFPAIREVAERPVAAWSTSPSGQKIADLGQVIAGHVRLSLEGRPGAAVGLRVAEVLDRGELALRPQRTARNADRVVVAQAERFDWEPVFADRSFRYIGIDDPAGAVIADSVRGVVVRNALERIGWFECSDPELNRLHENAVWSIGGNMLDVPSDCMLRDERLGWIGDAAHVAPAAAFIYDTSAWHASWLEDLAADQRPNGSPTMVVPALDLVPFPGDYPMAIFSDAACIAPMTVYQRFGDLDRLARQLGSMWAWTRLVGREVLSGFPTPGFQFGDWLDPTAPPNNPENGRTEYDVVMALGAIRCARLVGQAAGLAGDAACQAEAEALGRELVEFFNQTFVSPRGLVVSDSQTAYAMALAFGALEGERAEAAFDRLVTILRRRGAIEAGYPGTQALMEVLVGRGRADLAYRLLNNRGVPSWRFAVERGATTFWERWDSLLADGSLNPGDMLSFNHPVFGMIADWMHRVIGGLAPGEPGYRLARIAPQPGGGINWAKTAHISPYGRIEVAWELDGDWFRLDLTVPPGSRASVSLPGQTGGVLVGSGSHHFSCPAGQVPSDRDSGRWGAHQHV
ncbi:MAG: glycoside hydrolase family 78 protein [Bifidobacteriaceae bacterium]|jgi:alpha-L-rhamnosidase|nr:glycoside hydrolase family 78 protein [Bifidobacteriaceae bacterium]